MLPHTVIIIVGPTAVGKTSLAIQLAKKFDTPIISADSRQCFREMNIGVAKPTSQQLEEVKHYFINSHSIHDEVNAAVFEEYALAKAADIFITKNTTIMVGGTGLYVKAFCEGMDEIPKISADVRQNIIQSFEQKGLEWLQSEVKEKDPEYFATGEQHNPQRLMRALEVVVSTGRSIRSFQSNLKKERPFNIVKIGLQLPREILYSQINTRVDEMMNEGLLEEASALFPQRNLNALQTVGYSELFDYMEGRITLEKAAELIKQNTRHYAKRQITWFSRDAAIQWFAPTNISNIEDYVSNIPR
ncbi:tRNA (adenosine(37)-N6)-dimethylallyltransferase MiaA [Chitinophagaceae bacterium 26-R-25]|nr:tRNA (adenosine(37)-N6)-dimethylallyltransferase MiaA [Chitinophagaceae bacterium 26-R-25]